MDDLDAADLILIDNDAIAAGTTVECDTKLSATHCFLKCIGRIQCRSTAVLVSSTRNTKSLEEVSIVCSDYESCLNLRVEIEAEVFIQRFRLLCYGTKACDDVTVAIASAYAVDVIVQCGGDEELGVASCTQMHLELNVATEVTDDAASPAMIGCLEQSCHSLSVSTDSEHLRLTMRMHENSEDVSVTVPHSDQLDFVCGAPNVTRFLLYDTAKQSNRAELSREAQKEFESQDFPCDAIAVHTLCEDGSAQSCEVQYIENETNLHLLEAADSAVGCYWADISKLFEPSLVCTLCAADSNSSKSNTGADESSNTTSTESSSAFIDEFVYVIVILILFVLCVVGIFVQRKRWRAKDSVKVRNPMVIILGQAFYSDDTKGKEYEGYLKNLDGIDVDVRNLVTLFRSLNYQIFPRDPSYEALRYPRCEWTKAELIELFTRKARDLEASIAKGGPNAYDGLFLAMSAHGLKGAIITADHKLLSKVEIHRMFSSQGNVLSRAIPRIFLFDACDGVEDQKAITKTQIRHIALPSIEPITPETTDEKTEEKFEEITTESKATKHFANGSVTDWLWKSGEANPDHRLAVLNAANEGFQSKLNCDVGSYVIHGFWRRATALLAETGAVPLKVIFKEIQDDLGSYKQMPVFTWNNDTELVVLKPCKAPLTLTVKSEDELQVSV